MWHHARLLRRAVLLVSLLTLSGLHQQQDRPAAGWRAARLLLLSLSVAHAAGSVTFTVTSDSEFSVLYNLVMNGMILYGAFLMVYLLHHRRRLHAVLRRVAELEEVTAFCRRHGDYSFLRRQTSLVAGVHVLATSIWAVVFFMQERFEHPHYLVPAVLPPFLRGPVGYWVVVGLQMVSNHCLLSFGVLFDLLLVGLTDASTLLLTRLTRFCCLQLDSGDGFRRHVSGSGQQDVETLGGSDVGATILTPLHVSYVKLADADPAVRHSSGSAPLSAVRISILPQSDEAAVAPPHGPLKLSGACVERPPELESELQQLRQLYGSVSDLTSAAAALCSLPTLGLHAYITAGLLIGLYVNVALFRGGAGLARAVAYSLFLLLNVLRLALVSVAGSRLAERSQQLHAALAGLRWSGPLTSETRLTLQLLLAQTQQPLGFDGWGLFVTHKTTMQSLLSFVLTYFIIMVQMTSPSHIDTAM